MLPLTKKLQYPLAFIAGELAYTAAGFVAVAIPLGNLLPFPPANFSGPAYAWWAYDAIGFFGVYYRLIFYGVFFALFCLGMQVLSKHKLTPSRILLMSVGTIVLITITIYTTFGLELRYDPEYTNPSARNFIDAVCFGLIGGWYALAWWLVQRRPTPRV